METIIKQILNGTGINGIEVAPILIEVNKAGIESLDDFSLLTQPEVASIFNLPLIKTKKLFNYIKTLKEQPKEFDVSLPTLPKNFSTIGSLEVTGNLDIDLETVNSYLEFAMLYGMGVECMGKNLTELLSRRMDELDEPAPTTVISAYKTAAKFNSFDSNIAAALDFDLSMLGKRHEMAEEIMGSMNEAIISFINDALAFRLEISDINSLVLKRLLGSKVPSDVTGNTVQVAAEELAVKIARNLRGLNGLILSESLKLYKEVFELVNDTDLQKFIGAKDSKDVLRKLGIEYTPKDVASFQKIPEFMYQILSVLQDTDKLSNDEYLYKYLQNVWANGKLLSWAKMATLPKITNYTNTNLGENFLVVEELSSTL